MNKTQSSTCFSCGADVGSDGVGLNKKLLGKKVSVYFCLPCLAENLGTSVEDLLAKIEEFKAEGCKLFG